MTEVSNQSPEGRFQDARLIVGVTGSIAAYKAAELIRLFKREGAEVQVLMTPDAAEFITPLTLGTLAESEVLTEIFQENTDGSWTKHVSLGRSAALMVVAPATANTIAKLAHGHCDSMLTGTALSAKCPLLVVPAMDHDMYEHPATRANLERLREYGYHVLSPEYGELASGLTGTGRLPAPETIVDRAAQVLQPSGQMLDGSTSPLRGRDVLVTAGPTREALDPVRYISNRSTGTMGYALAAQAARVGGRVTLVSGPTTRETPAGVSRIDVTSAEEMHRAVMEHAGADIVIMSAAVADFRPAETVSSKIKKAEADRVLYLEETPDILRELGASKRKDQLLVGFALETDQGLERAREKLKQKNLDWIVLNNPTEPGAGFGFETNRVTLLNRNGDEEHLPTMDKQKLAAVIIDRITDSL
jgi:phosphopantothenoylcysteine decarboxylase/phosphopantothenate--cysteine ligase